MRSYCWSSARTTEYLRNPKTGGAVGRVVGASNARHILTPLMYLSHFLSHSMKLMNKALVSLFCFSAIVAAAASIFCFALEVSLSCPLRSWR